MGSLTTSRVVSFGQSLCGINTQSHVYRSKSGSRGRAKMPGRSSLSISRQSRRMRRADRDGEVAAMFGCCRLVEMRVWLFGVVWC